MYCLEIDTTYDISVRDICSIMIRYVKVEVTTVPERVFSILNLTKTSGEALCDLVANDLIQTGIDVKKCIGSSTDGAANMRDEYKGFCARLEKLSPNQLYV